MIKFCAKGAYKSDNKLAESAKQVHLSEKNLLNFFLKNDYRRAHTSIKFITQSFGCIRWVIFSKR